MKRMLLSMGAALLAVSAVLAQQTLTMETPVSGNFNGSPVDVAVTGSAGQSVLIETSNTSSDLAIEVYDANNNYVAGDDNSGDGDNASVGLTFPSDGQYRISVLAYNPASQPSDFTLTMSPLEIITETSLAVGETLRSILNQPPVVFDVTLANDMTILFSLLTYNFPPTISLTDSSDNVLASSDNNVLLATLPAGSYRIQLAPAFEDSYNALPYYAVTLSESTITPLTYGEPITRDDSGQRASFFTFDANPGDVLDLTITNTQTVGSGGSFTVYAPDNTVAFYSESSPEMSYLRAVEITTAGTYRVEVFPYQETFSGPYTVILSTSERAVLSATPLQAVFDTSLLSNNYSISVEQGKLYRVSVATDNVKRPITIYIQSSVAQSITASMYGGLGTSVEFVAPETATYGVNVRVDSGDYDENGNIADPTVSNITLTFEEITR